MPALKNRILLVGSWESDLREIGANLVPTLSAAAREVGPFDVVGLTLTALLEKKSATLRDHWRRENPSVQFVAAIPQGVPAETLIEVHNQIRLFRVLTEPGGPAAESALYEALENSRLKRQDEEIEVLLQDQESRLHQLRGQLEDRVEKRTKLLAESRHNLHQRSARLEALRRTLMELQEAATLPDMESVLSHALAASVGTHWIRIVPRPQDEEFARQIQALNEFAVAEVALWKNQERIGTAFFMRAKDKTFRRDDQEFLRRVGEAVSLALDRVTQFRESENLKEQWEATFAAITDPFAIISSDYQIIQSNKAGPEGQKCHERLFGRSSPCPGCRPGSLFRIEHQGRQYEVHSQALSLDPERGADWAHLYHDVTERLAMEVKILESAKMAELGTIGSSIAHELNNPLGGVLNFAQLVRMDLDPQHPFQAELLEIEKGARRCKEIVENLLGFSRSPHHEEVRDWDWREALRRALKIVEMAARDAGVEIRYEEPPKHVPGRGRFNLVTQALQNLLERQVNSARRHREKNPQAKSEVRLTFSQTEEGGSLLIEDSGQGPGESQNALALSLARQILRDESCELELNPPSSPDSWAKISFSRPVLRS